MKVNLEKMRLAMAYAGIDVADLCIASGIPKGTMNNVLNRKSARPRTIGKIAAALGVPAESLILDEKAEQKKAEADRTALLMRFATLSEKQQELSEKGLDVAAGIVAKELEKIQKQLG